MIKETINPEGMALNSTYSHALAVSGSVKTIYVGGQNGVNEAGQIVPGGLARQTVQALRNLGMVLKAAGAGFDDVVKWNIQLVAGHDLREAFSAFQMELSKPDPAPAIAVAFVVGLARPGLLIEIEAIAVIEG